MYILIILTLSSLCANALAPLPLNETAFRESSVKMDNIHHFILHEKYVTPTLAEHFSHYENEENVKLYQCAPSSSAFCPEGKPLTLVINTLPIDFNGNIENEDGTVQLIM